MLGTGVAVLGRTIYLPHIDVSTVQAQRHL
jgi:hypothetical protein